MRSPDLGRTQPQATKIDPPFDICAFRGSELFGILFRPNQSPFLTAESNKNLGMAARLGFKDLEETRQQRRATPIVDNAVTEVHKIVMRPNQNHRVRPSR
jgi:hypothetical protein